MENTDRRLKIPKSVAVKEFNPAYRRCMMDDDEEGRVGDARLCPKRGRAKKLKELTDTVPVTYNRYSQVKPEFYDFLEEYRDDSIDKQIQDIINRINADVDRLSKGKGKAKK